MSVAHPIARHCLAALLVVAASAQADPLAEMAAFSAFKGMSLEKLAAGSVKAARGPTMSFPRGLAVESCYIVRKPLAKTVELHQQWTPAKHPELKVYLHGDLPARPSLSDFSKLASAPGNAAVKSFLSATQKLSAGNSALQMSNAEAKAFTGDTNAFWGNLLHQRAQAFLSGGLARLPAYETGGESIRAADEVARLLKDAGKVSAQFSGIIGATPLGGGKGALTASPYWEMVDVEGEAAVTLGASYSKAAANGAQSVEIQYYASTEFYVLVTLQQMWPVTLDGRDATLVWRGDLISAESLAKLRGVEKMGSSTAMMRETQKSIEALLGDIAKAP